VSRSHPLSCLVVGDAAVTVRCAEILLDRGHPVLGLVTGDGRVAAWSAERGVPCRFTPPKAPLGRSEILDLVGGAPFDLLLSIHNLRIFEPEVLSLPRLLAVNYHDAPLPRYAGLHATTWAILAGERAHGITWHRMTAKVDAGDLLLQHPVPIESGETAWTLNGRCTEAAIETFPQLIAGLASGGLVPLAQRREGRTWFPGWQKPAPGCVVPWDTPAESISAFVRALDFGAADNPLGFPKILAPRGTFLVDSVEVLDRKSGALPGTVVTAGPGGVEVATDSWDVRLGSVAEPGGGRLPTADLARRLGLAPGLRLPSAAPEVDKLAARERSLHRQEGYWTAVLADLSPLAPPGFEDGDPEGTERAERAERAEDAETGGIRQIEVEVPPEVAERLGPGGERLLAALLAWLLAEIGQPFDVALGEPGLRRELLGAGWTGLFALRPPLKVEWAGPMGPISLGAFAARLAEQRRQREARGTYPVDLADRSRRLRSRSGRKEPAVAVDLLSEGEDSPLLPPLGAATLAVTIAGDGRWLIWRCREGRPAADRLAPSAGRFLAWLATVESAGASHSLDESAGTSRSTLPELFREQVARTPDDLALEVDGERWSYRQLARRAGRLAAALRRRGVGPERLVALRLERLPDLVTGILGTLEAGGAFLVLDPADSPERRARLLAAARPVLALSSQPLAFDLPVHPIAIADAPEGPELPAPESTVASWNLAYVAFTSGSTGAPKGVAVEHHSIVHYLRAAGPRFGLGPGDRLLQLGSPAFDLAYEQIFGALCHGATLVGRTGPRLPETRELLAECARLGITVLDFPTAVWEQVTRDLTEGALALPPTLRLVVIGGEAADAALVRAFLRAAGGKVRLLNTYGPTESTIVATWWEAPAEAACVPEGEPIPIGMAVEGIETHVLDPERWPPVPVAPGKIGERIGELWLGGAGLARGYHRQPAWTAARFVAVEACGGQRLYRTGDRVRQGPRGELEFLGRLDRQVKIAGHRVEPGEVEAVLKEIPGIVDAAVLPVAGERGPLRLAAWVVLQGRPGEEVSIGAIRAAVGLRLPPFLRPTRITPIAALPRSPAGKVDFRALQEIRSAEGEGPQAPAAPHLANPPRDGIEATLAALWERLLGADPVSRDADFFDLGGDSLTAVVLLLEIEKLLGRRVRLASLLRAPTLAALAEEIRVLGEEDRPRSSCLVPLQPAGQAPPLVCVHGLGGHLLRLIPLARSLAPDQPFLGLESPGLDDDEPIPNTVEELARLFLRELRQRVGAGPYHLCGMSFGGIVAFEMARQAKAAGEEIALLALFDTDLSEVLPGFKPEGADRIDQLLGRLRRTVGDRLGRSRRQARRLLQGQDGVEKANEYRHYTRVLRENDRALARYRPGPYAGKVTYFAATERDPAVFAEFVRQTGCDLEIVPTPGDHLGMLEPPHVEVLAGELRRLAAAAPPMSS